MTDGWHWRRCGSSRYLLPSWWAATGAGQGAGQDHGGENGLCGRHSGVHRDPPRPESQQCGATLSVRPFRKNSGSGKAVHRGRTETALFVSSAGMVPAGYCVGGAHRFGASGAGQYRRTDPVSVPDGGIPDVRPHAGALQNLAAVIAMRTNVGRMNEILDAPCRPAANS